MACCNFSRNSQTPQWLTSVFPGIHQLDGFRFSRNSLITQWIVVRTCAHNPFKTYSQRNLFLLFYSFWSKGLRNFEFELSAVSRISLSFQWSNPLLRSIFCPCTMDRNLVSTWMSPSK
jgi:hypothetical protein